MCNMATLAHLCVGLVLAVVAQLLVLSRAEIIEVEPFFLTGMCSTTIPMVRDVIYSPTLHAKTCMLCKLSYGCPVKQECKISFTVPFEMRMAQLQICFETKDLKTEDCYTQIFIRKKTSVFTTEEIEVITCYDTRDVYGHQGQRCLDLGHDLEIVFEYFSDEVCSVRGHGRVQLMKPEVKTDVLEQKDERLDGHILTVLIVGAALAIMIFLLCFFYVCASILKKVSTTSASGPALTAAAQDSSHPDTRVTSSEVPRSPHTQPSPPQPEESQPFVDGSRGDGSYEKPPAYSSLFPDQV